MPALIRNVINRGRNCYRVSTNGGTLVNSQYVDTCYVLTDGKCPLLSSWSFNLTSGASNEATLTIDISLAPTTLQPLLNGEANAEIDFVRHGVYGIVTSTIPTDLETGGDFDVDLPPWMRLRVVCDGSDSQAYYNFWTFAPLTFLDSNGTRLN